METPFPQRNRTRAPGFDYREPGPYFVTICEYRRIKRFGQVDNSLMAPNRAGEMVIATWLKLPEKYPELTLDAFVLMPNHFHGIVTLGSDDVEGNVSLSEAVQWFKTMTTNWYIHGVKTQGWPRFDEHLWQRSFHDRIVRTDVEMDRFRTYIEHNPALWAEDTFFEP